MAGSSGFSRKAQRLAAMVAAACLAQSAAAAMPGLYFAGFYMDSTLAYSSVDANVADFDGAIQGLWDEAGGEVLSWDSEISDSKDIGYAFSVGYQFSQYLAAELGYVDMGTVHYESAGTVSDGTQVYNSTTFLSAKSKGPLLSAIGILPLGDSFSLDARAGLFFSKTRLRAALYVDQVWIGDVSEKDNKNALMFGAGINWAMSPGMAIRLGYTRLSDAMIGEYDVNSWVFGLKYAW